MVQRRRVSLSLESGGLEKDSFIVALFPTKTILVVTRADRSKKDSFVVFRE